MKKAPVKPATEVVNNATPEASTASPTRILKVADCPTLSGKSTLTYHIGITQEGDIKFRVHANTGSGYFSNEWISVTSIQEVLGKLPKRKPITSYVLIDLFNGKSTNTPPFLFAALLQEGLVKRSEVNPRCYEVVDMAGFMSRMNALLDPSSSPTADSVDANVKTGGKKARKSATADPEVPAKKEAADAVSEVASVVPVKKQGRKVSQKGAPKAMPA